MLKWARERARRSYEDAAKRAGVPAAKVIEWEAGTSLPTVRQARLLSEEYERPFLEFFSKKVPQVADVVLVPDYRLHRGVTAPTDDATLERIQSWAETQRLNMLDLYEMLGDDPPVFPSDLYADITASSSHSAHLAREKIGFSVERQVGMRSSERDQLPGIIRTKIEQLGVVVLKKNTLARMRARGLCIYYPKMPIVVFGGEAPSAQAFTLAHELAHIILKQSAIIGTPPAEANSSAIEKTEQWCNDFAATFLVPESALAAYITKPAFPRDSISDQDLSSLANRFGVSRHAMLIRLVKLGYVDSTFYWSVKYLQLIDEESAYESFEIPAYYASRYRSSLGDTYTGLVLEAWSTGRITNHNAGEFMGIKNPGHLEAIRDNFVG